MLAIDIAKAKVARERLELEKKAREERNKRALRAKTMFEKDMRSKNIISQT